MMDFIARFDKFAATYKPKLKHENKNYKTFFGGIISILVYLLSLVYFSIKIYQFGSNSLNPIQSIAYEYKEELAMEVNGEILKFQIINSNINPFNRTNQILVPFMTLQQNHSSSASQINYIGSNEIYENNQIDFETQVYTPKNMSLSIGNKQYPSFITIGFIVCDPVSQENCASQTEIDDFFEQQGLLIRTTIITDQYNSFSKEITSMNRHIDFALLNDSLLYQRVIMEAQLLDIDDGVLFQASDQKWLFNDFSIQTQTILGSYNIGMQAIFLTELSISQVTQKKSVQFIKISTVLADVGSIFSSLMMISVIVSMLNEFWMEQELVNQVITIYYPQFQCLQFKRFLYFGSIREVKFNGKLIDLEIFNKFYTKAKDVAIGKLTVYSNIYQISRLQFALQSILSRQEFNKVHQQGIPLDFREDEGKSPRQSQVASDRVSASDIIEYQEILNNLQLIFKDEDFLLLDKFI